MGGRRRTSIGIGDRIEDEVDAPVAAAQNPVSTVNDADDVSDYEDGDIPPLVNYMNESDDEQEVVASPVTTVNKRVIREMRKLSTSYNPEANVIAQQGRVTRSLVSTMNLEGIRR